MPGKDEAGSGHIYLATADRDRVRRRQRQTVDGFGLHGTSVVGSRDKEGYRADHHRW